MFAVRLGSQWGPRALHASTLAKLIVTGASRDEAFAPSDPGQPFSVHTGWIESNYPVSPLGT